VIVDSSAVVAVLRQEPEADEFEALLSRHGPHRMSAATYLEAGIVIDGLGDPVVSRQLDALLEAASVRIEPVTARQARLARQAYRDFGRGSGHSARLNFGDCFAYALATDTGEPLLFTGDDFVHTDVTPAAPR
jgi:ribonuclease VapC